MVENILLVQELLRQYGRNRTTPKCLIKIDIKKAFDSASCEFLESVLKELGFHPKFISWTMQCVTSTTFSLSINGSMEGYFKGQRGLRQGDPISLFLFVIGMEYLSRMLKALHEAPSFKFHARCRVYKVTHLAFADDLIFFPMVIQIR